MSSPRSNPSVALSGWTVDSQQEATQVTADGRVIDGMTIFAHTGNGTRFTVFVPHESYGADQVRAVVAARAAALDSVHGMTG